jgi:hypothetical protein
MHSRSVDYLSFLGSCRSLCKKDLVSSKNKKNEESVEGLMSKITDSWDTEIFEFLGRIKIPSPHIPELHTTTPLF